MKKIVPTTIIMIVLVIAGFSLIRNFDASAEPVALSNAAMGELIGGCKIGHIESGRHSKGEVTDGKGALKQCDDKDPCPTSGSATWTFARIACDPCSRSKWKLWKECGHRRLVTRCKLDEENECYRDRKYYGSVYSCDRNTWVKCP